jgi:hypothetical protein
MEEEAVCFMANKKQRERKVGPTSSSEVHLLKFPFPQPPKISPPAGDQVFNT